MSPRPLAGPRLGRVLAIVPYVLANPGTTISDLARRFRVDQQEIERDLELLPMCGLPPYTADRLIDVWIDDDGAIDIRLAEYFERPLRLTPAEGVALVAAARALLAIPGADPDGPLSSAVEKLEKVIGATGRVRVDVGGATHLDAIRDAIDDRQRVEIDYFSYSRDEISTRVVDPERVFHALGAWYVAAFCHRADAERLFRVDRVLAVRPTGERLVPETQRDQPADSATLVYHPQPDDMRVSLRLAPEAAWVAESLPVEDREIDDDGRLRVVLPVSGRAFLERLLLRLGPDAEIVAPAEARHTRAAGARRILSRYSASNDARVAPTPAGRHEPARMTDSEPPVEATRTDQ